MTNGELVTAFIHAMERKDLDAACAMVTDDLLYDNVPLSKVNGPDGMRAVLEPFFAPCTAIEWVVHHQADTGAVVMNERTDRFKMGDRWVELDVAGLFVIRDGKISLWRDYFDSAGFQKALAGG